jgi:competence protein ComEC
MPDLSILDVGHGNTAIIRASDWVGLVDCAPPAVVLRELERRGVNAIDDLVVSHVEKDHAGGAEKLIRKSGLKVGRVWVNPDPLTDSKTWERLRTVLWDAQERGEVLVTTGVNRGEPAFSVDGVKVSVVHPDLEWALGGVSGPRGVNTMSAVVRVEFEGAGSVLLAADLTAAGLARIAALGNDMSADVLVFPHHGGHAGGSNDRAFAEQLMRAVAPSVVLFSLGRMKHANPQLDIVAGVRGAGGEVHIACTQMSGHCADPGSSWPDDHLADSVSAGRADSRCCIGTVLIRPSGAGSLEFEPALADHAAFVGTAVPNPVCR